MKWRQFWFRFKRWFKVIIRDEDLYLRFFALFLAIILWVLAGGTIRVASDEKTFTIPVQMRNIPEDFALMDSPESVRINLRSRSPWLSIAEQDTQATVDLSNAIEGTGTYGVDVHVPSGVEIISVSPRWVEIQMEQVLEKNYTVYIAALGLKPDQLLQSHLPDTDYVKARAPRSLLEQIHQVVVYVGLVHGANRIEGTFPIRAVDNRGHVIEGVSFFPSEVLVVLEAITREISPPSEDLWREEQIDEDDREQNVLEEFDEQIIEESEELPEAPPTDDDVIEEAPLEELEEPTDAPVEEVPEESLDENSEIEESQEVIMI